MRLATAVFLGLATAAAAKGPSPLLPEAAPTLARLAALDAPYRVEVEVREAEAPTGLLFGELTGRELHPSYAATAAFCDRFDPYDADDDEVSDAEIRAYLEGLATMAPIAEALRVTRRTLGHLQKAWFRRGRGFEHVICGEVGGRQQDRLGGYHFWYQHYRLEREGRARYLGAHYGRTPPEVGMADPHIVTGRFQADFDGPGGEAPLPKVPRGGFTVGHSVAAMLAAGHIAFYAPLENPIEADLNGRSYPWTFHRSWRDGASSVRTLWPRFVRYPRRGGDP